MTWRIDQTRKRYKRCSKIVCSTGAWRYRRCKRRATQDGYCSQHHPDAVAARICAQRDKQLEDAKDREILGYIDDLADARATCEELRNALQSAEKRLKNTGKELTR